jgi:hypothetical protein
MAVSETESAMAHWHFAERRGMSQDRNGTG